MRATARPRLGRRLPSGARAKNSVGVGPRVSALATLDRKAVTEAGKLLWKVPRKKSASWMIHIPGSTCAPLFAIRTQFLPRQNKTASQ